jgi:hypothetical protein
MEISKLEAGSWKLEAGSWKLEAGSWKLEAGSWKPVCETAAHAGQALSSSFRLQAFSCF